MRIRTRLTILFTIIAASILLLAFVAIYYFSSNFREQQFYGRLKDRAISTARLLLEVKEVDRELLKIIDKNTTSLPQEKISVYNYLNKEIYSSSEGPFKTNITTDFLNSVRLEKEIHVEVNDKEFLGIVVTDRYNRFVVVASALDFYGLRRMRNLRLVLIIVYFTSVIATLAAGWFYSGQALKPIAKVVNDVDQISATNLHLRVNEGNKTDEVAQLAITFNKMLNRLESAFKFQRNFVANASHELRTPLTSITSQIEVTLMKQRNNEEYERILTSVLEDIRNLSALSNGLLEIAHVSQDAYSILPEPLRIDELVLQARAYITKRRNCLVNVGFEELPEDEKYLLVNGNEQLLKTAFINLIDNACKFSGKKPVNIKMYFSEKLVKIAITDNGIGIPQNEVDHVFEPFFRASNTQGVRGHGLGLSLTLKIIELHNGEITVESKQGVNTTFTVSLPFV